MLCPHFLALLQQPGSRVNLSSLLASLLRVQLEAKHRAGPTHITPARAWDWELALPIFTSPKMLKQSFPVWQPLAHSIYIVFTADISDQSMACFPIESLVVPDSFSTQACSEADDAESEVPCGMIFTGHSCFRNSSFIMWAYVASRISRNMGHGLKMEF